MPAKQSFTLEALVDFVDDASSVPFPITKEHVDSLMRNLASRGVGRVIWGYYADDRRGWLAPGGIEKLIDEGLITPDQDYWGACIKTYAGLGNPLRVAVEAAHRHGMECYAYFKPYETGAAVFFPEGSPEGIEWGRLPHVGGWLTWMDPFVARRPDLRIKRRTDDLIPGHDTATIRAIKLTKRDDSPTRLRRENIEIWACSQNFAYKKLNVDFTFAETVEASPIEVRDVYNNVVTPKGSPVRVLTLSGLALDHRYIAVTTNVTDGKPDFTNAWHRLVTFLDDRGREIKGVYATGTAVWFPELEQFPQRGLVFDTGRGPEVVALDVPRGGGHEGPESSKHHLAGQKKVAGVLAFTRGRNSHLAGALCESEPEVRAFWNECLDAILDTGVDGVEFREENHSTHTDTPEDYGFNDVVMAQVDASKGDVLGQITEVRTEAYTQFIREASARIRARGKKVRMNLNADWFRPAHERPGSRKISQSANIDYDWRRWIDERLIDSAMLRLFATPFDRIWGGDATVAEMVKRCNAAGLPVTVNRYVWANNQLTTEFERVRNDGRFVGFVLYETWSFTRLTAAGEWRVADAQKDNDMAGSSVWNTRLATAGYVEDLMKNWERVRTR